MKRVRLKVDLWAKYSLWKFFFSKFQFRGTTYNYTCILYVKKAKKSSQYMIPKALKETPNADGNDVKGAHSEQVVCFAATPNKS